MTLHEIATHCCTSGKPLVHNSSMLFMCKLLPCVDSASLYHQAFTQQCCNVCGGKNDALLMSLHCSAFSWQLIQASGFSVHELACTCVNLPWHALVLLYHGMLVRNSYNSNSMHALLMKSLSRHAVHKHVLTYHSMFSRP